ncbi:MAG: bacteriophage holin [Candidatus Omnitrophica bacterium]|nr:bacteriophage holin [Candidatus Omnitrophota bacterium]
MVKLNVKALGLALGILWGASLVMLGIAARQTGYAADMVSSIGSKYIGYSTSIKGSVIGGLWGFCDAGIGGVLIAWLYNKFSK